MAELVGLLTHAITLENLLWGLLGCLVGFVGGVLPGIAASTTVALLLPFTFYLDLIPSMALLLGAYKGVSVGDSVSAILLQTPGTPAAAADLFDAPSLVRQGKAGKALWCALVSGFVADMISDVLTIAMVAGLGAYILRLGAPELFALIALALTSLIVLAEGADWRKGLIAIGFGFALGTVGMDPIVGQERMTFGVLDLRAGISLVPAVLGLMAFSTLVTEYENRKAKPGAFEEITAVDAADRSRHRFTLSEFRATLPAILRASGVGSVIGMIPALGAAPSAFINYALAKRLSKKPEEYGKGSLEGLAAAEAGANATVGPALVPLLTLGIPGSGTAALFGAAFLIQGIQPGPQLIRDHMTTLYWIFGLMLAICCVNVLMGCVIVPFSRLVVRFNPAVIFPSVIIISVTGIFALNNSMFDVGCAVALGAVGWLMVRFGIPVAPAMIAYLLGPILEQNLRLSMLLFHGEWTGFFARPVAAGTLLLTGLLVAWMVWPSARKKSSAASVRTGAEC